MLPVTNIFCKEDAQPDEYIKDKHDWSYEKVSERKVSIPQCYMDSHSEAN